MIFDHKLFPGCIQLTLLPLMTYTNTSLHYTNAMLFDYKIFSARVSYVVHSLWMHIYTFEERCSHGQLTKISLFVMLLHVQVNNISVLFVSDDALRRS